MRRLIASLRNGERSRLPSDQIATPTYVDDLAAASIELARSQTRNEPPSGSAMAAPIPTPIRAAMTNLAATVNQVKVAISALPRGSSFPLPRNPAVQIPRL